MAKAKGKSPEGVKDLKIEKEESNMLDYQEMLTHQASNKQVITNQDGSLDAMAFKKMIFAKEQGTYSGHNAYMAAIKEKGEFLEDSHLLKGLHNFGITYK